MRYFRPSAQRHCRRLLLARSQDAPDFSTKAEHPALPAHWGSWSCAQALLPSPS
jgi:hypothetical protein